jgi:hypothetical protein
MGGRFWSFFRGRSGGGRAGLKSQNGGCEQAGDFFDALFVGHLVGIAGRWHGAPPRNGSARGDFASRPFAARRQEIETRWYWKHTHAVRELSGTAARGETSC